MYSEFKSIDKVEADRILAMNTSNRPVSKANVESIKQALLRDEWVTNGESIKISRDGVLLDGQHRLIAVSETNIPINSLVVTGLTNDVFTTIDIGKTRGAGDMLALKGLESYNIVAAAVSTYLIWKKTGSVRNPSSANRPSKTQIVNLALSDERFSKVPRKNSNFAKTYVSPSAFMFLHVAFSEYNEEKANEFLEHLTNPDYSTTPKVVMLLREQLIGGSTGNSRLSRSNKIALIFKAFSYFCSDKEPKLLVVRTSGDKAEKDLFKVRKL